MKDAHANVFVNIMRAVDGIVHKGSKQASADPAGEDDKDAKALEATIIKAVKAVKQAKSTRPTSSNRSIFAFQGTPRSGGSVPQTPSVHSFSKGVLPQPLQRPNSINTKTDVCSSLSEVDEVLVLQLLMKYLELTLTSWRKCNIFVIKKLSKGKPLAAVLMAALQRFDLIEQCGLPAEELQSCVEQLEAVYKDNPYHNSIHAADVTQSMCALLASCTNGKLAPSDILSMVMGSAMHDAAHPGVSNKYLELTKDPKYQQHPTSTNEKNHIAVFFLDLLQKAENNFLKTLAPEQAQHVSSTMIEAVEFTDMMKHDLLIAELKGHIERLGSDISTWTDAEAHACLLNFLLHACDISNGVKGIKLAANWAERISLENWAEGDKERAQNLEVPPPCDRNKVDVPTSQIYFLDRFLLPTFEQLARIMPEVGQQALATGHTNKAKWTDMQQEGVKTPEEVAEALRKPEPTPAV